MAKTGRLLTSPADGSFFYARDNDKLVRKLPSGVAEELIIDLGTQGMIAWGLLVFPDGKDLLAMASPASQMVSIPPTITLYKVNVATHKWQKLGEVSGSPTGFVWSRTGTSLLFSRTVNDVTNLWEYGLRDTALTQVTFGAGPDSSPMPDPSGNGIYYVSGRESAPLTVYNTRSNKSFYLVTDDSTQPLLSWDGRHISYVTLAGNRSQELWISEIDGKNKVKLTSSLGLGNLAFSPDSSRLPSETWLGTCGKSTLSKATVAASGKYLGRVPVSGGGRGAVMQELDISVATKKIQPGWKHGKWRWIRQASQKSRTTVDTLRTSPLMAVICFRATAQVAVKAFMTSRSPTTNALLCCQTWRRL